MPSRVKLLFGTASINKWSSEQQTEFLSILKDNGIINLDTARVYFNSEHILGHDLNVASQGFILDTKVPGFDPGTQTKDKVFEAAEESLNELQVRSVETYYLHSPDHETPFEETLAAINTLHGHGMFQNFGLSNFTPQEVQKVYDICKENSYVLPTVYQGNYNAMARRQESTLFPLLRKLGISFYAYSPIAGGFLSKDISTFTGDKGHGRFDPEVSRSAGMYNKLYNKPGLLKGLEEWARIAKDEGISNAALAYRWVCWHSEVKPEKDDGVILGASRPEQLRESLEAIGQGPLEKAAVERIQAMWEMVAKEAPLDNFYF